MLSPRRLEFVVDNILFLHCMSFCHKVCECVHSEKLWIDILRLWENFRITILYTFGTKERKRKGKEEYIYIAPFCTKVDTKRSGNGSCTHLPANNTMSVFPSWAFTRWHHHNSWAADIQLQLTHLSTLKGWRAELAWLDDL